MGRNLLLIACLFWAAAGAATPGVLGAAESASSTQPVNAGDARANWWSFRAPAPPALPEVADRSWARNPIDAFILARLEKEHLAPSPPADRRTLIRRVSFDLVGLPPTPEETDAFVNDPDPAAYEKLVDRLLASPRYGERWARHWLDVIRNAESEGFEMNHPRPTAWPYRDYVIRAFNENKPYDAFVREQIAGDALGVDAATGYLVAGPHDEVTSPDPVLTAQQRSNELHDIVSTTSSTFLGITVGCARCHDHKFDPISQTDYYRMTAALAGIKFGERAVKRDLQLTKAAELGREIASLDAQVAAFEPVAAMGTSADHRARPPLRITRNVDRFDPAPARFVRFNILATNNGAAPCIDELEILSAGSAPASNVALASAGAKVTVSGTLPGFAIHKPEHLNDGRYGNDHSWISDQAGHGWAQIELPATTVIDRVVWGRDRDGKFSDRLPTEYTVEVAVEPGQWRAVASSADRRLFTGHSENELDAMAGLSPADQETVKRISARRKTLEQQVDQLRAESKIYAGVFAQPPEIHRLQRGDPMTPKEAVTPGSLAALSPRFDLAFDAPEQERRLTLARWITDPANPLTARVMVNRLWHYNFGRGIVATPSDFGHMGARPSHPALLDWLATEFVARGWDIKAMQRLIVLSATYRQSSAPNPAGLAIDSDALLLWRYPPRRLEAEPIRDSVLSVAGTLDLSMGGPGYDAFEPNETYVRVYIPKKQMGPPEWRRMIYQFKPRLQQDGTFGVFDCPDGGQMQPKRTTSTTPLQALNLLNSTFMMEQSEQFAHRLEREAGADPARQATRAFELAFERAPTDAEETASVAFIRAQGLTLFCRALYNANEFLYVS